MGAVLHKMVFYAQSSILFATGLGIWGMIFYMSNNKAVAYMPKSGLAILGRKFF